jgi:hypothetical protein
MTKKVLTDYQKKILTRLGNGEHLTRPHLGPFTPAFKFRGDKIGINEVSLRNLRFAKLATETSKLTMHGLIDYYHLPGQKPWESDKSHLAYLEYKKRGGR